MNKRAYALDALRGYAIITMVLSATVAWNSLPGWMYHAQTPPPDRAFDASLSGITWVDLVFPFFLFAMGAAFPFSIKKRFEKGDTKLRLVYEAIKRGVQLTFFAIFIQHFYPYVLSNPQDVRAWLLSILCFHSHPSENARLDAYSYQGNGLCNSHCLVTDNSICK